MSASQPPLVIRALQENDFRGWKPLWDGYNAFYGRQAQTALPSEITQIVWQRFHDPCEPVFALVAEADGELVGLAHYLFHRSTTRVEPTCYLRDLFTLESRRGYGIGKALIEGVCRAAKEASAYQVYWQTHQSNVTARRLYDSVAANEGFIVYSRDVK
ncbi:MAG: GNAT family N-acetyltransferase [Solirubrobacterales bacterium]